MWTGTGCGQALGVDGHWVGTHPSSEELRNGWTGHWVVTTRLRESGDSTGRHGGSEVFCEVLGNSSRSWPFSTVAALAP